MRHNELRRGKPTRANVFQKKGGGGTARKQTECIHVRKRVKKGGGGRVC